MDLRQLESFIKVVETGSFTKAAELMRVSQPSISMHVQNLETELHTTLLQRDTKKVKITDRGKELYDCATMIIKTLDKLTRDWADEENGIIRLGASTIPSGYILPEVLATYQRLHPEVRFEIHQGDSEVILNSMKNGNYQIGLVGTEVDDEVLVGTPFYSDRLVMITPSTIVLRKQHEEFVNHPDRKIIMDILMERPLIFRENGSGSQRTTKKILASLEIGDEDVRTSAALNDTEAIKNMVACGLGVAFVSEKAVEKEVEDRSVIAFPLDVDEAKRNLNIVIRRRDHLKKHEEEFIKFLMSYYAYTRS